MDVATVVVECEAADVEATDRVRDFDQLSPAARRAFLDAVTGSDRTVNVAELDPGDVIRFTAYYRVV
ncbi:hypothetical protein DVK02_04475 [Halobellus sp. Atlit-31R]|nr:hypothetical protein DVK02_04475 [Halobellus sp. Atlit-31R]